MDNNTKNLLKDLNDRLNIIRSEMESNRAILEKPEPGRTFMMTYQEGAALLLVLRDMGEGYWLCCKMSIETMFIGPFDLLLDPEEWTGGYSIIIEAWNVIILRQGVIGKEFLDKVGDEWLSMANMLYDAIKNNEKIPDYLSDCCGPEMDEMDDREEFQEKEADILNGIRQQYCRSPQHLLILTGSKASIAHKFSIDKRLGFDIPYMMAIETPDGKVVPTQNISPKSGEWDLIQSKGFDPRLNCIVHSGILNSSLVEKVEGKIVKWAEINRQAFAILLKPNTSDKIKGLEKMLKYFPNDPYIELMLGWILLSIGDEKNALEYFINSEKRLRPEFQCLAQKSKEIILGELDINIPFGKEPIIDVWRIRAQESDISRKLSRLKEIWLQTSSGYVAYELAMEYKYMGSLDPDNLNYDIYTEIRYWAEQSLSAQNPISKDMQKWPIGLMRRIDSPVNDVDDSNEIIVPSFYVPIQRVA